MYLKIVNYHSINMVYFLQKNLKGINPTSKNQVFDCFSAQEHGACVCVCVYVSLCLRLYKFMSMSVLSCVCIYVCVFMYP